MSTTGQGTPPGAVGQAGRAPAQPSPRTQPIGGQGGGTGTSTGRASAMRDGAMARTAPRRDLSAAAARARAATRGRPQEAGTTARPPADGAATARRPNRVRRAGPRRVRLTLQRVDPWSVLKISFLVSFALAIAGVIAVAVLWSVLSGMNVFSTVNDLVQEITTGESGAATFDLMDYLGFGRVMSLAVVIGVLNVFLLTALATLAAFLYNVCSALVGGAQVTLSDE